MNQPNIFYCYALLRPDSTPFYVGKGQRDRILAHEYDAARGEQSYKARIIRKIIASGASVGYVKFAENLTAEEAIAKEIEMIKAIGRKPHGPLVNLTDGGEGVIGYKKSPEDLAKQVASRRLGAGYSPSAETRSKIAATVMRTMKEGAGRRSGLSRRGKPLSPESVAKREATKLAKGSHKHTPESRAKISATRKARGLHGPQTAEAKAKRVASRIATCKARGYFKRPQVEV